MAKKRKKDYVPDNEEQEENGPDWTEEQILHIMFPNGELEGDDWPDYND